MIGIGSGEIWAVVRIGAGYGLLSGFGWWYDRQIAIWQRAGLDEGGTGLEVIGGVLVTLLVTFGMLWGQPFGADTLLLTLGAFGAAGYWMARGSLLRYARRRRAEQDGLRGGA